MKHRHQQRYFQVLRKLSDFELNPGPTVTFISEVRLTQVEAIRKSALQSRPSYTAFVIKALALALRAFPYANRRIGRRVWVPFTRPQLQGFEHCDIAVAAERNVEGVESVAFVDVLRDADQKTLIEITEWLRDVGDSDSHSNQQWSQLSHLIERCPVWLSTWLIRLPYFAPQLWAKYRGGAALVSSPAKYGVDSVVACWSWPLGISFGLVKQRVVVDGETITSCPTFNLVCNFDRRIMAGAQAGRFFAAMVANLEDAQTALQDVVHVKAGSL